jgi:hypothetical protein
MREGSTAFLLRNLSTEVPLLKKNRFPYIIEANSDQRAASAHVPSFKTVIPGRD